MNNNLHTTLVYARAHAQTTWVLDVSPGVGRTPGEPEESRSTKAQYTCGPYMCTQYICLYICWAAGFDDGCFYYYKQWFSTLDGGSMRSNLMF